MAQWQCAGFARWKPGFEAQCRPRPVATGIPGNMSLEKFPREFPGILLRSALNILYTIISSFAKCSYIARHNVKVHYNFADSIETLKKNCLSTSVPIKSDLDEFTNVFLSTNFVSPARRHLKILHRTQQSTLFDIRMTDLHRCPV